MLFLNIIIGLIVVLIGVSIYLIARIGSMSDEDRRSYGHGPKGQGR